MALWTPYAEEALDLTRHNITQDKSLNFNYGSPLSLRSTDSFYYDRSVPCRVPSSQISPDSVKSWHQSPDLYDTESLSDDTEYQAFEKDAFETMAEKNGGCLLGNNPRMKRAVHSTLATDEGYRQQRERNNFAAKQSRDRRKLREVRLAFQVTFLKKKLADLRARLDGKICARCQKD